MNIVIKLLLSQSGQTGGFFWGGFGTALSNALREQQKLGQQRKEAGLREKLVNLQIEKLQQAQAEQAKQQAGEDALVKLLTEGVEQPTAVMPSPERAETDLGIPAGRRPATKEELRGAFLKAQGPRHEVLSQMAKELFPTAATGVPEGFTTYATPQQAQAALAQLGVPGKVHQTTKGWVVEQINPVNVAANEYHRTLAATGNQQLAMQAFNAALFQQGASTGAGGVAGKAGQELGEPIQPMQPLAQQGGGIPVQLQPPMGIQPGQVPGTVTQAPTQPSGPYPTPAGGPGSPAQRALRQRQAIQREERPLGEATAGQVASIENLLTQTIPNIRNNLDEKFLGPVVGTDIALEGRRRLGTRIGMPVSDREITFRTALKDASDQLLRARSGAQINEQEYRRLASILPQATDEPQVFKGALDRFERELRSLMASKLKYEAVPRGAAGAGSTLPPPPPGWR